MDKNTRVLASAAIIAVAIVAIVLVWSSPQKVSVACTMEAKLCPDGTSVGRSGPNCEFASCPAAQGCPKDLKVCPDGSKVSRTAPGCEFASCPSEPPVCAASQYSSPDCSGACATGQECKQVANTACYACASRVLNCYEWTMYPNESECRSKCFYPKWCTFSDPGCWKCNEPYDIRPK